MNNGERAADIFKSGLACSQAVLVTFAEELGLDENSAMKIASGFAAGMRLGEVCGAVTGALMVIGLSSESSDLDTAAKREKIYKMTNEFHAKFKEKNSSVICRDILKCDPGTKEGMEKAQEDNLFVTICPQMVKSAVEIIETMNIINKTSM